MDKDMDQAKADMEEVDKIDGVKWSLGLDSLIGPIVQLNQSRKM